MVLLHLNPEDFPILSNLEIVDLSQMLKNLCQVSFPHKSEISEEDVLCAAIALEMDLQSIKGKIWKKIVSAARDSSSNEELLKK